jgi:CheY-like chemotaxis protein
MGLDLPLRILPAIHPGWAWYADFAASSAEDSAFPPRPERSPSSGSLLPGEAAFRPPRYDGAASGAGGGDGADAGPLPDPDVGPDVGPGGGRSPRVLIVEDNWLIAIEIETILLEAGYEVIGIAMSADQAAELCGSGRPDFVLMDIRLQGTRDGVDAAVDLRQRFGVPSIFVTAHGEPETRARAQAAQPLGWIIKPIAGLDLVRRLGEIRAGGT